MPFQAINGPLASQDLESPVLYTDLHARLGEGTCSFHLDNGWLAAGIQQGGNPNYYSILMFTYGAVIHAYHTVDGWFIRYV